MCEHLTWTDWRPKEFAARPGTSRRHSAALHAGKWKYLTPGNTAEFLFDLESGEHERKNLIAEHPDLRDQLHKQLERWCNEMQPAGLPTGPPNTQEAAWYRFYFQVDQHESQ